MVTVKPVVWDGASAGRGDRSRSYAAQVRRALPRRGTQARRRRPEVPSSCAVAYPSRSVRVPRRVPRGAPHVHRGRRGIRSTGRTGTGDRSGRRTGGRRVARQQPAGQRAHGRADRLVYKAVQSYGLDVLGVLVRGSGLVQLALGAGRLGRWFRAVSAAVVQGCSPGSDWCWPPGRCTHWVTCAREQARHTDRTGRPPTAPRPGGACGRCSDRARPDALATMAARSPCRAGALARGGAGGDRDRGPRTPGAPRRGPCLLAAVRPPPPPESLGRLTEVGVLGAVAAFALIASAESLFGAAAVDRLHRGKRADRDRELMARGWGSRSTACRAPCR